MAALPYIQIYIADYLADTMHLTTEEHGAYMLIIYNYWQTGKPIPKKRLPAISRLNGRWTDVEDTLSEFFNDDGEVWQHDRIDEDLLRVMEKQTQASLAGKASAAARKARKKQKSNENPTGVATDVTADVKEALQQKSNHKDTDTDTDTNTSSSGSDEPDTGKKKLKFSDDDLRAAEYMLKTLLTDLPDYKKPKNLDKWADTVRLMCERDNRSHREICEVWKWARADSFWQTNILSPGKLRDKYDQLKAKMRANHATGQRNSGAGLAPDDTSWIDSLYEDGTFGSGVDCQSSEPCDPPLEGDFSRLDGGHQNAGTGG